MRHKISRRKLNRTSAHRKSLLINLSAALLKNEIIKTTLPKAKELRPYVEKVITICKVDSLQNRRRLISLFNDLTLVNKLFSDLAPRVVSRNGGYVRIMHCGFRVGDKAPMALVELVDRVDADEVSSNKDSSTKVTTKKKSSVSSKKKVG